MAEQSNNAPEAAADGAQQAGPSLRCSGFI